MRLPVQQPLATARAAPNRRPNPLAFHAPRSQPRALGPHPVQPPHPARPTNLLPPRQRPPRSDVRARSAALTADDSGYQSFQLRLPFSLSLPAAPAAALATAATIATVMVSGIANRVLYRMALVPMQDYVFFLAQFQTFGYVVVYFALLHMRSRAGKVTPEMLQGLPKGKFMLVGACEAAAQVLLMVGAAQLPGAVLPLVSQSALLWNMALSTILLHTKVRFEQVAGALLVIGGVAMAAWPSGGACPLVGPEQLAAVGMCCLSFLFPSLGASVKERIFADAQKRLGRPLDLFVVNSYGSASQAIFVAALLPALTALRGMPLAALPDYLTAGSRCFLGLTPACGGDCTGAPLLPTLYVATNLIFNVSALNLLRSQGTVALSLCMAGLVPLSIWAFSLPLPYLDPCVLGPMFLAGTLVLMLGLLVFNFSHWRRHLERFMPVPHQS